MTAEGTLVIGGGFAGLAAATHLAERGEPVTLLEARSFVGGKVYSFEDPESGHAVDNGQHAFLDGYRNTRALLARWKTDHLLEFQPDLGFTFRSGHRAMPFRCAPWPAPLHLAWPLLSFQAIGWRDRLAMGRVAIALLSMPPAERRRLDGCSFHDWLRAQGQGEAAIASFWEPLALAAVNGAPGEISCYAALQVLAAGFLTSRAGSRFGFATQGLSALYEGVEPFLAARGGQLRRGQRVERIERTDDSRWRAWLVGHDPLEAPRVILAVPPSVLGRILPPELVEATPFREARRLTTSPIVSIQLTYDRAIADRPVTALLDSPIHWVFDAARLRGDAPEGALSLVVSGASRWLAVPNDRIAAIARDELARHFPAARTAQILACRVIKEAHATIACAPGSDSWRPGPEPGPPGLFLAGAWTATGLPATIEGAVISGLRAVEALEARRGRACRLVQDVEQPDFLAAALMKFLGVAYPAAPTS